MKKLADVSVPPRVKVAVTDKEITQSIEADSSHCMIADAVKKAVPHATNISVDIQTIRYTDRTRGVRYIYLTPRIAQLAILAFDEGEKPAAFSVLLRQGQVVPSGGRTKANVVRTPAQEAALKRAQQKGTATLEALSANAADGDAKAVTVRPGKTVVHASSTDISRPVINGGKVTPKTTVGRRRVFGLRAIGRGPSGR